MKDRVEVLHGANLDLLGSRDPEHYGSLTLGELEVQIKRFAHRVGPRGDLLPDQQRGGVHRAPPPPARARPTAALINAGAWTHYSYAIRDALELAGVPAVEVHLSDVGAREEWRRASVFDGVVGGVVSGKGPEGYREALELLKGELAG